MDLKSKNRILEIKPDTVEFVRKEYNLDKPGQMEEAVSILRDWVQKQNHLKKKDFGDRYYELTIIACKGSVERAKTQIDRICTLRTLLPQFFGNYNAKTDFADINDFAYCFWMPKVTSDHYRIEICKFYDSPKPFQFMDYYRRNIVFAEYVKSNDYIIGCVVILDFSDVNLMEYVTKLNVVELRQAMTIFMEGYGMRIKGIHIITASTLVDTLVTIVKQVVSPKVAGRIQIHKTFEGLYEFIPKSVLPKDYGGEEPTMKELHEEWMEELSSEEHMKHIQEMNKATTDEALRQKGKFNEEYAGMPGTFRMLSVD